MVKLPVNDPVMRLLAQAKAQPEAIAVIDGARQISYRDFVAKVGQLAAAIMRLTTDAPCVLIDAPQGIEVYQSIFAALMAGGTYSVLNPQWPEARQRLVVDRFQPDVVLALESAKWPSVTTIGLAAPLPEIMPAPRWGEGAYVLFTSGSTGVPKGVQISRHNLTTYLDWVNQAYRYAPGDRASQYPSPAFDVSVTDIFGALCGGATLVAFTSPSMRAMPARGIRDCGITVWNSVPSIIDLMQSAGQCTPEFFSGLRFLNFCGEPFYTRQAAVLRAAAPQAQIQNSYGPTETTVTCTELMLPLDWVADDEPILPLGTPVPRTHIMVEGEPGQIGEIIVAGAQVATGYLNDAAATTRAFTTRIINGRQLPAYHTGDLGEYIHGQLYSRGRIDRQVKITGYRVELAEIEAAISAVVRLPCYALLHAGRLTLFMQADKLPIAENAIQQQAALVLPAYAVPQVIRAIGLFPRNHNDKIDIAALATLLDTDDMKQANNKTHDT